MLNICDIHCHLNMEKKVSISNCKKNTQKFRVAKRILLGTQEGEWEKIIKAAKEWMGTIPAIGWHPWWIENAENDWKNKFKKLLIDNPQAMVGEVGLDNIKKFSSNINKQETIFEQEIEIACELKRKIIIHCTKAYEKLENNLANFNKVLPKIIIHSVSCSKESLKKFLKYEAYFSINHKIALSNFKKMRELIKYLPDDRVLVESDTFLRTGEDDWEKLAIALNEYAKIKKQKIENVIEKIWENSLEFLQN